MCVRVLVTEVDSDEPASDGEPRRDERGPAETVSVTGRPHAHTRTAHQHRIR